MYKKFNYNLLNLQLFSEPGEGGNPNDPGGTNEPTVPKKDFDKLAKELASYKRKNMSDVEKLNDDIKERDKQIADLQKSITKSNFKSGLSITGIEESYIESISAAFIEGDSGKLVKSISEVIVELNDNHKKEIESLKLSLTPRPGEGSNGGSEDNQITKEQFNKMTYNEMLELKEKNPELFNKLIK